MKELTDTEFRAISLLIIEALQTDGAHHKQWFLYEIANLLSVEIPEHLDKGIAP